MKKPKSVRSIRQDVIDIDPELARDFLSRSYKSQRPIRKSVIANYAFQMRNGSWHQDQPDCVLYFNDDASVMYNGQHRMHAIIESNTTQRMRVEYGATEEDYRYMDAGVKRSVADQLGRNNSGSLATLGKMAAATVGGEMPMASCLEGWTSSNVRIPGDMIVAYVDANEDLLRKCISYGNKLSKAWANGKFRAIFYYAAWLIYYAFDSSCFSDFVDDFCEDGVASTNAVAMLQKYVSKLAGSSTAMSVDKASLVAAVCCAYESYCGKDDKKRIQNSMLNKYRNICDQKITEKRLAQNAARAAYIEKKSMPKSKRIAKRAIKSVSQAESKQKLSIKYPQVGSRVQHVLFGYGKVTAMEKDRLHVQFDHERNPRMLIVDVINSGKLVVV